MPKTRSFDSYCEEYDMWFKKNETMYKSEIEVIKSVLPINAFGLEIGVGTGMFSVPFDIKTGIDPSYNMAVKAKKRGIDAILAVSESLPFKNNIFDFVLIVTSICFFDNIQRSLTEARRVLKKNGIILIGFVAAGSPLGKKYYLKKEKSKFYKDAEFYTAETVTKCLQEAQFMDFEYKQALFEDESIAERFKDGYGEGSFIVIKAKKLNSI